MEITKHISLLTQFLNNLKLLEVEIGDHIGSNSFGERWNEFNKIISNTVFDNLITPVTYEQQITLCNELEQIMNNLDMVYNQYISIEDKLARGYSRTYSENTHVIIKNLASIDKDLKTGYELIISNLASKIHQDHLFIQELQPNSIVNVELILKYLQLINKPEKIAGIVSTLLGTTNLLKPNTISNALQITKHLNKPIKVEGDVSLSFVSDKTNIVIMYDLLSLIDKNKIISNIWSGLTEKIIDRFQTMKPIIFQNQMIPTHITNGEDINISIDGINAYKYSFGKFDIVKDFYTETTKKILTLEEEIIISNIERNKPPDQIESSLDIATVSNPSVEKIYDIVDRELAIKIQSNSKLSQNTKFVISTELKIQTYMTARRVMKSTTYRLESLIPNSLLLNLI